MPPTRVGLSAPAGFESDRPVRLALVGLGYWGPNILRVLADSATADVRWLCDLDESRLERFGRRHPTIELTTCLDTVLADPEVDAVIVATPVFTHYDVASRVLRSGKHVFVEKPLAPSAEQADRLVSLADERGLALMCGHIFLYSPPVQTVKQLLRDDAIGSIFFISSSRVNLGLHQRDVSVVWDLGPHDFSILLYWLDETPISVRASGRDSIVPGIADVAFVTLNFPSGVIANIELSWLAPSKLRRTVVVGDRKMVIYEDGAPEPVRVFDRGVVYRDPETFGEYHLSYRTGDVLSPRIDTCEPLALELDDFMDIVRSGRRDVSRTNLARDVVALTEAADRSLRAGGAEIMLPRSRALDGRSGAADLVAAS
jgi:predicted dehydrogenase